MLAKNLLLVALLVWVSAVPTLGQAKRKVIIDQDCAGPGGTDMQAILTLINSSETEVLAAALPPRPLVGATRKFCIRCDYSKSLAAGISRSCPGPFFRW